MSFCTLHSQVQMDTDSGRNLEGTRQQINLFNIVETHSYQGGKIMVWAGISLGSHTDLHVFNGGTLMVSDIGMSFLIHKSANMPVLLTTFRSLFGANGMSN